MRSVHDIIFRPWALEDIPRLAELAGNPEIPRNMRDGFPHPYTGEDARAFISMSMGMDPVCNYAVLCDGVVAGGIGYVPGTDVHRISTELGYWFGREYWGRGIATEAVISFSAFVFGNTPIIHLHAGVFSRNRASIRVLEKAGYSYVGTMHRCVVKEGEIMDLVYYELPKASQPHQVKNALIP